MLIVFYCAGDDFVPRATCFFMNTMAVACGSKIVVTTTIKAVSGLVQRVKKKGKKRKSI